MSVQMSSIDPVLTDNTNGGNRFIQAGESKKQGANTKDHKRSSFLSIIRLFRNVTCVDIILLLVASFAAICEGGATAVLFLLVGDLNDRATERVFSQVFAFVTNGTVNCTVPIILFTPVVPGCTTFNVTSTTTLDDVLATCVAAQRRCITDDGFLQETNILVYILIGIAVIVLIASFTQTVLFQITGERQVQKIRLNYYRALLRQDMGWFDANSSGALASRLTEDIERIHDGITENIGVFIQFLSRFIGGLVIGLIIEWRLTLLLIGCTPLLVIAGAIQSTFIASFASAEQREYAAAGAVAEEVFSSVRTVVAFGGEVKEAERYQNNLKLADSSISKRGLTVGITGGLAIFAIFLVTAASFWFGAFLIQEGLTVAGPIITVFFAMLLGSLALNDAAPLFEALLSAAGAAEEIYNTIDRVPEIDSSSDKGLTPDKFDSFVQLKDVFFSYPTRPDVHVLKGLNLDVKVGQTVALVGPSGCGKSTVIQLLQRFYNAESGEVMVGGHEVSSLNIKWLRRHIGVVSQEPVLFDTSIAENIRYGRDDATMEDIEKAAKNANAHDFIKDLPNGYNTVCGELGSQLSGGQKQRIAIARALVQDPKLLFLDEATSALDAESESIVQQALDKAREGRTTIVIAHRLSTIQSADVIASIEDGQVVEMGTHSELMDKHGLYYELVTAQTYDSDVAFIEAPLELAVLERIRSTKHRTLRRRNAIQRGHTLSKKKAIPPFPSRASRRSQLRRTSTVLGTMSGVSTNILVKQVSRMSDPSDIDYKNVSLRRALKYNSREWWLIALGVVGASIHGASWPVFVVIIKEVLGVYTAEPATVLSETNLWGGLFIVVGTLFAVGVFLKHTCFSVSGGRLTSNLRLATFKAILRQEIGWHDEERNGTGELTARLADDTSHVQGAIGSGMGLLIQAVVSVVLATIVGFFFNWLLTLLVISMVPALFLAGGLKVKTVSSLTTRNKKVLEDSGMIAVDSISNIRTVASLAIEDTYCNKYTQSIHQSHRSSLCSAAINGLTYAVYQSIPYLMFAALFRFAAFQFLADSSSFIQYNFGDSFAVFIGLVFGTIGAGQAEAFAPHYVQAKWAVRRLFALLDREPLIDAYSEDGQKKDSFNGEISASDLLFSYPTRTGVRVLKGLDISVKPGQTLALVGPSGCGKSTVVSLLERFYDPSAGQLTLDGTDTRELNIHWLRSKIGIVSQEPVLFDASIADNVRYGANFRTVSDEEVIEATKAANIHNFIESLPQGYGTNVGGKGTQLSGGQKQRIAIARALVRDPKVLLLDEATSALDTESEKVVQEALDKAREGRTSIVIAHRLSTIYNADCIAVLGEGKVVEKGTHSELMAKKGIYYKLNRFQVIEDPSKTEGHVPTELQ